MSRSASLLAAALALAAAGLAACGGGQADKAGGSAPPVTLRLGTPDEPARAASDDVERFAARVRQLSGSRIKIKIVWEAGGRDAPRRDQRVAELVRTGTLDAGLVPARAWDAEGVTSLQALQAPFLITSKALVERVVTSALAGEMLSGMQRAGVAGLALLPESLRHPFGFGHALTAPGDFAGATIQSPPSDASYRVLRALGARPVFLVDATLFRGVRAGTVAGAESSFQLAGPLPVASIATGNVTLFSMVNALVVNQRAFAALTDGQRRILRRAASDTLRYVLRTNPSETETAAEYCRNGGTVIATSGVKLAALERAAQPAYGALEQDPQTRRLIERIRRLKHETAAASRAEVAPCRPGPTAIAEKVPPRSPVRPAVTIPDGIYRKNVTERELLATGIGKTDAFRNYGLQTLTLKDGHWRGETRSRANLEPCTGTYSHSGASVTFVGGCAGAPPVFVFMATWRLADGNLYFTIEKPDNAAARVLFGGRPWRKIG
jgi:TRAP-type C4-dicarboxylate transport system substrate-binding protein